MTYNNCNIPPAMHVNAFLDLNGMPYLVAEYLDRRNIEQIDPFYVRSEINVDQSEAMRTVIDVSVDDIGKNETDGRISAIGNSTKQVNFLNMIERNFSRLNHELGVLRKGLVLRINYQLENQRTNQVIRTTSEDLKIKDRNYFLSINPKDINDNAIIVNFNSSLVSTISEFTHGRDQMILRITSINMFYEWCMNEPKLPNCTQSLMSKPMQQYPYCNDENMYNYHNHMQHQHVMTTAENVQPYNPTIPPQWSMFNRYYHFDTTAKDVVLHIQEVEDPRTKITLLPCGTITVNRAFVINPYQRLVFKFSIWKNDITIINDTRMVANALQAPVIDPYGCCNPHYIHNMGPDFSTPCPDYHGAYHYPYIPDSEPMCGPFIPKPPVVNNDGPNKTDYEQNAVINQLTASMNELKEVIKGLHEGSIKEDEKAIETLPEKPTEIPATPIQPIMPPHHHHNPMEAELCMLREVVKSLQRQINELKPNDPTINPDGIKPMPDEEIKDVVEDAADNTNPDKSESSTPTIPDTNTGENKEETGTTTEESVPV